MTALTLPRSLPYMGKLTRWLGAGLLAGAVAATTAAGGYHVDREVAGTGSFAGAYCKTTAGPIPGTATPDTVTIQTYETNVRTGGHTWGPYKLPADGELVRNLLVPRFGHTPTAQWCWN